MNASNFIKDYDGLVVIDDPSTYSIRNQRLCCFKFSDKDSVPSSLDYYIVFRNHANDYTGVSFDIQFLDSVKVKLEYPQPEVEKAEQQKVHY
jgi:hypothetical protein